MVFRDRTDAGKRLAVALGGYKGEDVLVLALPRGGVPVAVEVARALKAPLDLMLVRKIGAPFQPELAIGAVVDGNTPVIVRNDEIMLLTGTRESDFEAICARERAEIERRRVRYFKGREPVDPKGCTVILVDDGIATGATTRAALWAIRTRGPQKLILAVPVAARSAIDALQAEADEIICLESPEHFRAVGNFYDDFPQVSDAEVIGLLSGSLPKAAVG